MYLRLPELSAIRILFLFLFWFYSLTTFVALSSFSLFFFLILKSLCITDRSSSQLALFGSFSISASEMTSTSRSTVVKASVNLSLLSALFQSLMGSGSCSLSFVVVILCLPVQVKASLVFFVMCKSLFFFFGLLGSSVFFFFFLLYLHVDCRSRSVGLPRLDLSLLKRLIPSFKVKRLLFVLFIHIYVLLQHEKTARTIRFSRFFLLASMLALLK